MLQGKRVDCMKTKILNVGRAGRDLQCRVAVGAESKLACFIMFRDGVVGKLMNVSYCIY